MTRNAPLASAVALAVSLALALALAAAPPTRAIVIRHDRDDAAYRAGADRYPMVCNVGGGMGTLVAPEWILTAAHVAEGAGGGTARCGDRELRIAATHLHPDYADGERHRDVGLVRLESPADGIEPARLHRAADEVGRRVTFVGDGRTGTGLTGPVPGEPARRVAQNTVESARPGWIVFRFDAPPAGDELEGISGPGDSGGPALVEVDGALHVIGVSAYNEGKEICRYGTREHYARVSDALDWIEGTMRGTLETRSTPRLMRYEDGGDGQARVTREEAVGIALPDDDAARVRRVAEALARALNEGTETARDAAVDELFAPAYVARRARAGDPVTGMLDFLRGAIEARGPIVRFHDTPGEGLRAPDASRPMVPVVFHLRDGMPGYFGLALDEAGRIEHLSLFVQGVICAERERCTRGAALESDAGDAGGTPESPVSGRSASGE